MRSIAGSVNDNDDLVSGFNASIYSGDNVYEIFENKDEIIIEGLNVWFNTN